MITIVRIPISKRISNKKEIMITTYPLILITSKCGVIIAIHPETHKDKDLVHNNYNLMKNIINLKILPQFQVA